MSGQHDPPPHRTSCAGLRSSERPSPHDAARSAALVGACAALVLVPLVGPRVTGRGEGAERLGTALTPPAPAFAIWGPIFLCCAASTAQQVRRTARGTPRSRSAGWPLAGAYATNAAWSVAAQTNRLALTPVLLPVATGFAATAFRRLQPEPRAVGAERLVLQSTGLLLGWTSLASAVNLLAGATLRGADPTSPSVVRASSAAAVCTAGGLAAAVARTRQGALTLAAGPVWGLAATALARSRPRAVRLASGTGALAVAGAALVRVGRDRRTQPRPDRAPGRGGRIRP